MKYYFLFLSIFFSFLLYMLSIMIWYKEENNQDDNITKNDFCINEKYLKNVKIFLINNNFMF